MASLDGKPFKTAVDKTSHNKVYAFTSKKYFSYAITKFK